MDGLSDCTLYGGGWIAGFINSWREGKRHMTTGILLEHDVDAPIVAVPAPALLAPAFIAAARDMIGVPFVLGGRDAAHEIDCAGLVVFAAASVGADCPRLMARRERVRQWWPALPPPHARLDLEADLLASLDADLERVPLNAARVGDILLLRFPANFVGASWYHLAIATARADRKWGVIHADPYPPKLVCARPIVHWSGTKIQSPIASWDRCVERVYRLRE